MSYCICSNNKTHGYCVGRSFYDPYKCKDFIQPFYPDYFGKVTAAQLLTFDSIQKAIEYMNFKSTRDIGVNDTWIIRKYDPCMNCIGKEERL